MTMNWLDRLDRLATDGPAQLNRVPADVAMTLCHLALIRTNGREISITKAGLAVLDNAVRAHEKNDINSKGVIVGSGLNELFDTRPVRWKRGVITELPTLPGSLRGEALGINGRGHIVGSSSQADTGLPSHAVLWRGDKLFDLGALGGRDRRAQRASIARAINDAGVIVGYGDIDSQHNSHAVRWDTDRRIHDLGTLAGGLHSSAFAVNLEGTIVGISDYAGALYQFHSVAWVADAPQDLGTHPGHDTSVALGINSANVVVGRSAASGAASRAVVWFGLDQTPIDLNTLLRNACSNDRQQIYPLVEAIDINDAGVIAATGVVTEPDGAVRLSAFRLVPR